MRILLTGAVGFSGRFLARRLAESGHEVRALVRRPTQASAINSEDCAVTVADLSGSEPLPSDVDAVVHTASTSPAPGVDDGDIRRDNLAGMERLVAHALGSDARRFVFFSSISVYGRIDGGQVDERTPIRDPDLYGETKAYGESLLAAAADRLPSLALRLPAIVGPGAKRNWPATTLERIRRGESIAIYNPDAPFNNAVHIADLAEVVLGFLKAPWSGTDIVTLGAQGKIPVRDAVLRMMHGSGRSVPIEVRDAPRPPFTISSKRAISRYGYRPMEIGAMMERFAREQAS